MALFYEQSGSKISEQWLCLKILFNCFMFSKDNANILVRIHEDNVDAFQLEDLQYLILRNSRFIIDETILVNKIVNEEFIESEIKDKLEELINNGFIIREKNKVLSLVLQTNPYIPAVLAK